MGKVMEVEVLDDGVGWGQFLRVRIEIPLHKVIARGRIIKLNGNRIWASFKYKKLPRMCFQCGWILHGEVGCDAGPDQRKTREGVITQFEAWL